MFYPSCGQSSLILGYRDCLLLEYRVGPYLDTGTIAYLDTALQGPVDHVLHGYRDPYLDTGTVSRLKFHPSPSCHLSPEQYVGMDKYFLSLWNCFTHQKEKYCQWNNLPYHPIPQGHLRPLSTSPKLLSAGCVGLYWKLDWQWTEKREKLDLFSVLSWTVGTLEPCHIGWELTPRWCRHKSRFQTLDLFRWTFVPTRRMECIHGLCRWLDCSFSGAEAQMLCWVGSGSRKPGRKRMS